MERSKISVALLLGTLFFCGCISETSITRRSQLLDPFETGEITVLMGNGNRYTLTNYRLTDSTLVGAGYFGLRDSAFRGELGLSDISYVCTRNVSFFKSMVAVGVVTGFIGLTASYLGSEADGLAINEIYGFYYPRTGGGSMSCPFVYTWDGSAYHFESETFAGAVFKKAERSSYDVLHHLRATGGVYRLRITNERPETEYTNETKLLVVDAPQGTVVVADTRGRMHTMNAPVSPLCSVDFSGEDVTALVTTADEFFWKSNLSKKDLTKDGDLKDGLVVEFKKPAGVASAKLMVRGVNTDLGGFAFKQLFSLRGPNFLEMYKQLESDASLAGKMLGFMRREGMLHVKVWKEGAWVDAGELPDVGPSLCKEQMALLDIRGVTSDILRIRLECSLDLWTIDRVAVDFSPDRNMCVRELEPLSAVDETGRDIVDCLRADDDRYYVTVPGDFAEVSFEEIAPVKGMDRWYVLKTKGYYHIWPSPGEIDQWDVVEKILSEPLYGNRMYMPLWKKVKERSQ